MKGHDVNYKNSSCISFLFMSLLSARPLISDILISSQRPLEWKFYCALQISRLYIAIWQHRNSENYVQNLPLFREVFSQNCQLLGSVMKSNSGPHLTFSLTSDSQLYWSKITLIAVDWHFDCHAVFVEIWPVQSVLLM